MSQTQDIHALRGLIRDREAGASAAPRWLSWLVELRLGAVHEWFESEAPPRAALAHVTTRAIHARALEQVIWIGREVFPYPLYLDPRVRSASLFIDAPDPDARLWAADLALRSGARAGVIADASRFTLACTRRLQLAARSGEGVALLARPRAEETVLSAATTRWLVEPARQSRGVGWMLTLLRNKDNPTLAAERPRWVLHAGARGDDGVRVHPVVASGTDRARA
ncbi:MAG: hypothetical protein JNL50_13785 [Phycisphaerae bacterium]|nr:hypothetical protein [Phycisphaerae bacterium]